MLTLLEVAINVLPTVRFVVRADALIAQMVMELTLLETVTNAQQADAETMKL